MDKLEAMRVFVAVVETGSFVAASRRLERSAPAITRTVARLEQALNAPLLHRSTRFVRVTDSGQRYFHDAKAILERVDEAEAAITGSYGEPRGQLNITAPVLFGQIHIAPIIIRYLATYKDVTVNAVFQDRFVNLLEDNLEIAIRIGHLSDSSLFATPVGEMRRVVCASPTYLEKHGTPQSPSELPHHAIIQPTSVESLANWTFGNEKVKVAPRYFCNQNAAAIEAACNDCGITRVMSYQVAEQLEAGTLTLILEDFEPPSMPINVVYLEGRRANAKIRSFVKLAVETLRNDPALKQRGANP